MSCATHVAGVTDRKDSKMCKTGEKREGLGYKDASVSKNDKKYMYAQYTILMTICTHTHTHIHTLTHSCTHTIESGPVEQ